MTTQADNVDTYHFTGTLFRLWTKAENLYRAGKEDPDAIFDDSERAELAALGLGAMDVYDYVEDFVRTGEPDFGSFVLVTAERVFFFFGEAEGRFPGRTIREEELPARKAAVDGMEWLPRILAKARAKLRGELPPDLMYGCGGDRKFLRGRGIHPAEFLRKVREAADDREVVEWVAARSAA